MKIKTCENENYGKKIENKTSHAKEFKNGDSFYIEQGSLTSYIKRNVPYRWDGKYIKTFNNYYNCEGEKILFPNNK
jgi:hypothetical protein